MANVNVNPNARYNTGTNVAGGGRASSQATMQAAASKGLAADGIVGGTNLQVGQNVDGGGRSNTGPNVAGAPRSVNNT